MSKIHHSGISPICVSITVHYLFTHIHTFLVCRENWHVHMHVFQSPQRLQIDSSIELTTENLQSQSFPLPHFIPTNCMVDIEFSSFYKISFRKTMNYPLCTVHMLRIDFGWIVCELIAKKLWHAINWVLPSAQSAFGVVESWFWILCQETIPKDNTVLYIHSTI